MTTPDDAHRRKGWTAFPASSSARLVPSRCTPPIKAADDSRHLTEFSTLGISFWLAGRLPAEVPRMTMDPTRRAPRTAGAQTAARGDLGAQHLTATQWLVAAADDPERARLEWAEQGITLLRCGALFAAVRLDAALVHAAAGVEDPDGGDTVDLHIIDAYLAQTLLGGPVFLDARWQRYYVLVPAGTADLPRGQRAVRDRGAQCLDSCYLGVPDPLRVAPEVGSRSYWCVTVNGSATLCAPDAVAQLVERGRHQLTIRSARTGG
jgi:hypothetical protein